MTPSNRRHPPFAAVVVAAAVIAITACSGDDGDATTTTIAATTTTVGPSVVTDGKLVIGLLRPTDDTLIGDSINDAFDTAISRINEAGGVLGRDVSPVVVEEGATAASASSAIETLIERDVDAIIGPSSSLIALSALDEIVSAGKLACSPTASAMALDDFPDMGLFFRTIPSDSLQAEAIAQAADQTGAQRASIVHVDDAYGRPFANAVQTELQSNGIGVIDVIPFRSDDDDLTDEVSRLLDSDTQVAIVLADGDDGSRLLDAMNDVDTSQLETVVVNDALRNPTTPQRIQNLDPAFRDKIVGLAPQAEAPEASAPFDPPGLFAANAYDCVNLIALAAVRADSDAPSAIADQMSDVSFSGSPCRSFSACVEATDDGLEINYDGPSGVTEIQPRQGDPARATFDRFFFDAAGQDLFQRAVVVGG